LRKISFPPVYYHITIPLGEKEVLQCLSPPERIFYKINISSQHAFCF